MADGPTLVRVTGERALPTPPVWWRPSAPRLLVGFVAFVLPLAVGLAWFRTHFVRLRDTVRLVDGSLGIRDLHRMRASEGPPIDAEGIVRVPLSRDVVNVLVSAMWGGKRYVYDPLTYFRNRPDFRGGALDFPEHPDGVFEPVTNGMGLREDGELRAEKPDLRILVTGDSHAEGVVPNRESFTNVLETLLARGDPSSVEALNAACGGYSVYNYLGVLEKYLPLDPDVFVMAIYGGNDFEGAVTWYRYFRRLPPARGDAQFDRDQEAARLVSVPAVAQALRQLAFFHRFPEERELGLAAGREVVLEAERLCRANGIRFLCAYLPSVLEVQPELARDELARTAKAYGLPPEALAEAAELGSTFVEFLRESGVEFVDLRPALAASTEPAYWRTDLHLNTHGHRLVAEELARRFGGD